MGSVGDLNIVIYKVLDKYMDNLIDILFKINCFFFFLPKFKLFQLNSYRLFRTYIYHLWTRSYRPTFREVLIRACIYWIVSPLL